MRLFLLEKNGTRRVALFTSPNEFGPIQSVREVQRPFFCVAFLGHHVQDLRQSFVHAVQEVDTLGVGAKAATTLVDFQPEQVARERRIFL
jgi:hypothetical protein